MTDGFGELNKSVKNKEWEKMRFMKVKNFFSI